MHLTTLLTTTLTLLPLLLPAAASPIPIPAPARRDVGTEICTTVASGVLSGGATADHPQNFFVWDSLLYYGGSDGLEVEFQRCDPNFQNFPQNSTLLTGHLYVPYLDQCLTVATPAVTPPHTLSLSACWESDDSGQILQQFWQVNGTSGLEYVWAGFTDNMGDVQNAATCPGGTLGYAGPADLAEPPTDGVVQVVCLGDADAQAWRIIAQ